MSSLRDGVLGDAMADGHSMADHDRPPRRRPGPWGTSLYAEKRWGYPSPYRSPLTELERRIEAVERALAAFWLPASGEPER